MPTYSGPKAIPGYGLAPAARRASATSQGYDLPFMMFNPADADMMARIMLAESSVIRNPDGSINMPALQGVADVIRNRVISKQFPNTVEGVLTEERQFEPYETGSYARSEYGPGSKNYDLARAMAESALMGESAPTVGGALNYGNIDTILSRPNNSARTIRDFTAMANDPNSITFRDFKNPRTYQHTFGVLPNAIPVNLKADGSAPSDQEAMNVSTPPQGIISEQYAPAPQPVETADAGGEFNFAMANNIMNDLMQPKQTQRPMIQPQVVRPRNTPIDMLSILNGSRAQSGILG